MKLPLSARIGFYVLLFLLSVVVGMMLGNIANATEREKIALTTANTVVYRGVVTDDSVLQVQLDLAAKVKRRGLKSYPIYLVMDSPGGSIDAGLAFIEYAKNIPNLKTISLFSASMASAIAEALPGERLLVPSGVLMFHRAQGGFQGYFENGEVESRLGAAKDLVRHMEEINASRMQMSLDTYKSYVQSELWLFGNKAVAYRSADRVVDVVCTPELIKQQLTVTVSGFLGMTASFMFSGCPLMRSPLTSDSDDFLFLVPTVKNYQSVSVLKRTK